MSRPNPAPGSEAEPGRGADRPERLEAFVDAQPRLLSLAYRLTGSRADAEDLVQESWLRWQRPTRSEVDDPVAYLARIVTHLALDYLRSARVRRERYVGPWLPEPLVDAEAWLGPLETLEEREQLSLATLALLERLSPRQRAVVGLREAFAYPYEQVTRVLDSSPTACRQVHHRARVRLGEDRPKAGVDPEAHRRLLHRLLAALATGELAQLEETLAADVVLVTDGGGKVVAARHPLVGPARVARFLLGIQAQAPPSTELHFCEVNGWPGLVATVEGVVVNVLSIVDAEKAEHIAIVRAPDKLARVTLLDAPASQIEP